MKLNKLFFSIVCLLAGATAQAAGPRFGTLALGGNACTNFEASALVIGNSVTIPLRARIVKADEDTLARGTCNFSLPVQLPAGKRLVIDSATARHRLDMKKGSTAITRIEVFFAGSKGAVITDKATARYYKRRLDRVLVTQDETVSACGASLILRGNAAGTLTGENTASAQIPSLRLNYTLENCP